MSKPIYLKLDTCKGVITIPFLGMREVDRFTVMYSDKSLVNGLIEILGLSLENGDITDVYLTYDKYNRGKDDGCFPIKYMDDNFNFESLEKAYVTYLKNDKKRILSTDIRYVRTEPILKYFGTGMIENYEIENAVRKFFADGTGYKRKRDTYFLIKKVIENVDKDKDNKDANITIIIDKVNFGTSDKVSEIDLGKYSTGGEDHLNDLIELYRRYPELSDKIMDEIGQSDLEDIKRYLKSGIVDGASDPSRLIEREIALLEQTTGLSIDELRTNNTGFGRRRRSRR